MYRKEDEVKPWREKDPILRLRKVLESKKLWTEKQEEALLADCAAQVQAAIKQSEATPMPALSTLMDDLFTEPTPRMRKQLAEVEQYIAQHGPLSHGH